MMENTELINALRYCTDNEKQDGCDECPYLHNGMCHTMLSDAADALEAADNRIKELEKRLPKEAHWVAVDNGHGVCSNCNRQDSIDNMATHCRYCGARMETVTDCHTLDERRTV